VCLVAGVTLAVLAVLAVLAGRIEVAYGRYAGITPESTVTRYPGLLTDLYRGR
jgi:hypothetical protein